MSSPYTVYTYEGLRAGVPQHHFAERSDSSFRESAVSCGPDSLNPIATHNQGFRLDVSQSGAHNLFLALTYLVSWEPGYVQVGAAFPPDSVLGRGALWTLDTYPAPAPHQQACARQAIIFTTNRDNHIRLRTLRLRETDGRWPWNVYGEFLSRVSRGAPYCSEWPTGPYSPAHRNWKCEGLLEIEHFQPGDYYKSRVITGGFGANIRGRGGPQDVLRRCLAEHHPLVERLWPGQRYLRVRWRGLRRQKAQCMWRVQALDYRPEIRPESALLFSYNA